MKDKEKNNDLYKTLIQKIPDIAYEIDTNGNFTFINEAVSQLGYTPEELIGKHFREIIHPDDIESVSRLIVLPKYKGRVTGDEESPKLFDEKRTKERMTKNLEMRLRLKDSQDYLWMEVHSSGKWNSPVTEKEKKFLGSMGIMRDITHRKQTERLLFDTNLQLQESTQRLCLSETKFRTLIENNADGIIIVNRDGIVRYLNPAAITLFGRRQEELMGALFGFPMVKGETTEIELLRVGEPAIVEMRVVEMEWWEGEQAYMASLRDITRHKQMEELKKAYKELKDTQDQLIQAEKLAGIGQLAAGIAHEIRNPLTGIVMFLNLIKENYPEDFWSELERIIDNLVDKKKSAIFKEHLGTIKKDIPSFIDDSLECTERIDNIVNQLLTFSRKDTEKPMEEVDINREIEKSISFVWTELKHKCTVTKDLHPLPMIPGYSKQLEQVFVNLLTNAGNAIEDKGLITIMTKLQKPYIFIKITDNGKGIPEEHLNKIFEPFFTTKEVGKGTGLGLSVVYNIISKHKGTIDAKSSPGKGTTFTIKLPVD